MEFKTIPIDQEIAVLIMDMLNDSYHEGTGYDQETKKRLVRVLNFSYPDVVSSDAHSMLPEVKALQKE